MWRLYLLQMVLLARSTVIFVRTNSSTKDAVDLCATSPRGGFPEGETFPTRLDPKLTKVVHSQQLCNMTEDDPPPGRTMMYVTPCQKHKPEMCYVCGGLDRLVTLLQKWNCNTLILYPILNGSDSNGGNYYNISTTDKKITLITAVDKPARKGIPRESEIHRKYFKPTVKDFGTEELYTVAWVQRANRILSSLVATTVITLVACVTVTLGARNAAEVGYVTYLAFVEKRKRRMAKAIVKRAVEKRKMRERMAAKVRSNEEPGENRSQGHSNSRLSNSTASGGKAAAGGAPATVAVESKATTTSMVSKLSAASQRIRGSGPRVSGASGQKARGTAGSRLSQVAENNGGINENRGSDDAAAVEELTSKEVIEPRKRDPDAGCTKESCDWRLVVSALIAVIIVAALLIILWVARDYIFDIFDVVFMLCSISAMVAFNCLLRRMPCGAKRLVVKICGCCNFK